MSTTTKLFQSYLSINNMFKNAPKVLAHKSALSNGNFVTPEFILNQGETEVNLFHRFCPHRRYPLAEPGTHVNSITCNFHNFQWTEKGIPINNDKKLNCGKASISKSGLILTNFVEPTHQWVDDLSAENNLEYIQSTMGHSTGSWLWLMDAEADYLHVHESGIHKRLSSIINLEEIVMDQGEGWILQTHKPNWWSLYIFPYTFIEYAPGCLSVNYVTPITPGNEFGFNWITQFYYDPKTSVEQRLEFETLEDVFKEDVVAIEKQKGPYFPLMKAMNRYEDHCVHFGKWFKENLEKNKFNNSSTV